MQPNRLVYTLIFLLFLSFSVSAQEDLLAELDTEEKAYPVTSTFKGTRLISGHTVKMLDQGVLDFVISHRFGRVNEGAEEFFGLDNAQIRLGLEYGITDFFTIGIGRSSFQKVLDGYAKARILEQKSSGMPISLVAFGSIASKTGDGAFYDVTVDHETKHRLYYTAQLLAARKFSSKFSAQLAPIWVHRNLVQFADDPNDVFALGVGARYKVTNRIAINAEWYPQLVDRVDGYYDALSVGVDIETGGHVFQIHLTNSRSMIEEGFVSETTGTWSKGDIHIGFNISRVFDLSPKK
ncbi:DUF5777 family beta-barrel protein [Reichenbachiella ulvae]|uniref:DUF5777 family beta-barrel protein n=1 Tax=Reichenbachiella ulvae TaxID=2980104 RepID=A0ABT3CSW7_9BACT|nr:DUF5777 family beta-barrel protein [Reichenbachiella ulvae]MCV9386565.1 DUF5777 family beta-barrel protein [Reichenbachiella ulvae]